LRRSNPLSQFQHRWYVTVFFISEVIIISLFEFAYNSVEFFYLYISVTPLIIGVLIYLDRDLMIRLRFNFSPKDIVIIVSVVSGWLYIYAVYGYSLKYVFDTLYYPVMLEEFNFRFLVTNVLGKLIGLPRATVVQAFLYSLLYLSVLYYAPLGYPGIYFYLFPLDNFMMGLFYGALYMLRKSISTPMSLHLSLYLMDVFIPPALAFLPYTLSPV